MILNSMVSRYLARLASRDSHSRCLSIDVTLLSFFLYLLTCLLNYEHYYARECEFGDFEKTTTQKQTFSCVLTKLGVP